MTMACLSIGFGMRRSPDERDVSQRKLPPAATLSEQPAR
jgi:hypothetical protein